MKVAIISPTSMLTRTSNPLFHLVLPHLFQHRNYRDYYMRTPGFKILDNGEAEGELVSADMLHAYANMVNAQEIVVPDCMGDLDVTMNRAYDFGRQHARPGTIGYMGVLQGRDVEEMLECLAFYNQECPWMTSYAVPRCYAKFVNDKYARVSLIADLQARGVKKPIHCLGSTEWLEEVKVLATLDIRSMDTSMPVVLGLQGLWIEGDTYVKRGDGFFSEKLSGWDRRWEVIDHNVRTFIDWATPSPAGELRAVPSSQGPEE